MKQEPCLPLSDEVLNNPNLKLFMTDFMIETIEADEEDKSETLYATIVYQIVDTSKLTESDIDEFETLQVGTDLALENEIANYGFCGNYTEDLDTIVAPKEPDTVGFWPAYRSIKYHKKSDN